MQVQNQTMSYRDVLSFSEVRPVSPLRYAHHCRPASAASSFCHCKQPLVPDPAPSIHPCEVLPLSLLMLDWLQLFALVDSDRSGQISSEEVAYLMRLIGNSVSLTEVDEMIASYDDDKSGELSLAEFLCVIADQRKSNHKKKDVMRAFELFAKDCGCRTGVISRDALLQALQNFGMSVATKDEIADVVGALPLTVTGDFDFSKHVSTFLS